MNDNTSLTNIPIIDKLIDQVDDNTKEISEMKSHIIEIKTNQTNERELVRQVMQDLSSIKNWSLTTAFGAVGTLLYLIITTIINTHGV